MRLIRKSPIIFGILSLTAFFAFAKQEKVIQLFRNGEIIQEYSVNDIDYIEVNDLIAAPSEVSASVSGNYITITWNAVEGATYNVYRSPDNTNFALLASDLTETTYTDTAPLRGSNFYRVTAIVDGNESKDSDTVAAASADADLSSGIYLGIYGFSKGFQTQSIQCLTDENESEYHEFVNNLSATEPTTWLYFAVDKSIDYLQSMAFPVDLSEVAIVTFTDGLDVGSLDEKDKEEFGKYQSNTEYREALHTRLTTERVADVDISAYTIGVLDGKTANLTTFRNNMSSLATATENVFEVEKMENVYQVFEQIANSLSETNYVQQFVLSISGLGQGELCRFTFDDVSSYSASKLYIEGTFRRSDRALTDIKYVGLTSTSGSEVVGVLDNETGKYNYTFEGLKADDGSLIPTTNVQHWFTDDGIWQDVDDEFYFNPDDASLEKIKRSAAIMLNLDCSSSMNGEKLSSLQAAVNNFVSILYENSADPSEVTSVSLNKTELSLQIGETACLTATVLPTTAKLKTVSWQSTNPSVATVDGNGNVTAVALGQTDIIVTTTDGAHTATCTVDVIPTPAPQNLVAIVSGDVINVSWNKADATAYTLYRSTNNSDYDVIASNLLQGSYIDENPATGANYYKLTAKANNIVSDESDCIVVKFTPSPSITNIERNGKQIIMTWSTVSDASYNVYRGANSNLNSLTQIASNLSSNSYTDQAPLSNENYYIVRAVLNDVESQGGFVVSLNYPFINGYEYVDLGLPSGLKWATQNVGASSPTGAGNYYAWGEKTTKSTYTVDNCSTIGHPVTYYDAANSILGGTWRVPEVAEFEELINNCTWTWTTMDGVQGYRVTGPNGNSIFLPTTGLRFESALQTTDCGFYWSSSRWDNYAAWRLNFNSQQYQVANNYKFPGLPIRPVSD